MVQLPASETQEPIHLVESHVAAALGKPTPKFTTVHANIVAHRPCRGTGVRQVLDAYRQVTNTAGGYQVEGAKKVATLNIGGSGTTSCAFVVGVDS